MEDLVQKVDVIEERSNGSDLNEEENELFIDSIEDMCQPSNSSSDTSTTSEAVMNEEQSQEASSQDSSSSPQLGWPIKKSEAQNFSVSDVNGDEEKSQLEDKTVKNKQRSKNTEIEMMKERFSKLLLGEDMSGSGEGVCTALAISNAITNLCATLFGQLWRLEPLPPEKKAMWRREMEWLLCVSDHIVELVPSWQTFPDGSKLEVMTCRPRSDLYVNLPALRKLDHMLLEVLDSFSTKEFWYVDQGILAPDADGSVSLRRPTKRQEEKWWLPVPCVPPGGLHESSRRHLQHKRECTNQILKAAMAINNNALDEMEVPESYLQSLPKNGKASLGDVMHKYMTSDHFSPECLLDCLALSSEYQVLEIANRVESSIYVWRQRGNPNVNRSASKSSWSMVKELMVDTDKRELLVDRAVSLLICLKQRFPGLPQTTLDMNKIQYNKDVGKSILEGYSRVLESLASNIMARIDDLVYVDDLSRHSDQFIPVPAASVMAHQRIATPYLVPALGTQYSTAYINPSFSPSPMVRHFGNSNDSSHRGLGMKKGTNNRVHDANKKIAGNPVEESDSIPLSIWETDVQNGVV